MKTTLSKREFEMVELTAFGLAQKEIASHLHISPNTVDVTIRHAKEKLNVQKSTELAAWYFVNKYHIRLDISPVTRAILSLSFLSIIAISIFSGFKPERIRSQRVDRAPVSRLSLRGRRVESEQAFQLITA